MDTLERKLGFPDQYKILDKTTITEPITRKVDTEEALFFLGLGPCTKEGYKKFLALEIDYTQSQTEHSEGLGVANFGATLLSSYADTANEIAVEYCNKHGLIIIDHLLSSPKFQAVVKKL